ncbi:MAG: hypothetical protein Q8P98_02935 [Candidatus Rokubacteria bacterium]|nr:hypothetical protein [Candidatus Rokubacteria bacterium]
MRSLIGIVILIVALAPAVATAESWVLWERDYVGTYPNADLKSTKTVGLYPSPPECLTAARAHTAAWAKDVAAWRETRTSIVEKVTVAASEESTNPPGVRAELKVAVRMKKDLDPAQVRSVYLFVLQTQCWPAGVTPR